MAFLDEVDELKRKAPLGSLPKPVAAGIVGVIALVLVSVGVTQAGSPGFVIERAAGGEVLAAQASETADGGTSGKALSDKTVSSAESSSASPPESCYVYVVGAVNHSGVYQLPAASRVNDAVAAAGGFASDAAPAAVNLARAVEDGEQITIPTQQQVEEGQFAPQEPGAASAGGAGAGAAVSGVDAEGKINLNTATSEQLQTLNGIGEVTAGKIIASREQEGPFATTEDLKRVSGIGEKKYAAIAGDITV